jgi:hypothetical protein
MCMSAQNETAQLPTAFIHSLHPHYNRCHHTDHTLSSQLPAPTTLTYESCCDSTTGASHAYTGTGTGVAPAHVTWPACRPFQPAGAACYPSPCRCPASWLRWPGCCHGCAYTCAFASIQGCPAASSLVCEGVTPLPSIAAADGLADSAPPVASCCAKSPAASDRILLQNRHCFGAASSASPASFCLKLLQWKSNPPAVSAWSSLSSTGAAEVYLDAAGITAAVLLHLLIVLAMPTLLTCCLLMTTHDCWQGMQPARGTIQHTCLS